jgi:predicted metal-dependent peptidase
MAILHPNKVMEPVELIDLDPVLFRMYQMFVFWADIQERCSFYVTKAVPTAAVTERWDVLINPDFYNGLTVRQQTLLIAHEVGHIVLAGGLPRVGRSRRSSRTAPSSWPSPRRSASRRS